MEPNAVAGVRRFNRVVTARVGALSDDYLARSRPLGQSRVLWEIGLSGCEVGVLRARLGLDSAQLSRTLRALEADGLVAVDEHRDDGRVRLASLTPSGVAEWRVLDAASETAAGEILEPLTPRQRDRLLDAMGEVERLLMASLVEIGPLSPSDPLARMCLRAYRGELEERFGTRFESSGDDEVLAAPRGMLLVAVLQSEPVGCGGLAFHPGQPPEIKRLWVAPAARGMGLGRRLLTSLEQAAAAKDAKVVRLDTNQTLTEAIALYRSAGYLEIERYNDNPHAHHWFEKRLRSQSPDLLI